MNEGIIAYRERESTHWETGTLGILRDEWRSRRVSEYDPKELIAAWGTDWRRHNPFATWVLEHRYIRHGVEEPWTPAHAFNEFDVLLRDIDSHAVAILPELKVIQDERVRLAAERKAEEEAKQEQERINREVCDRKMASENAFRRLVGSPKPDLGLAWNAWIIEHQDDVVMKEKVRAQATLYAAVFDAVTVPAKRKAIRAFLAEFGKKV